MSNYGKWFYSSNGSIFALVPFLVTLSNNMVQIQNDLSWTKFRTVSFRFLFVFFTLFILLNNNGAFPFWSLVMQRPTEWLQEMITWLANYALDINITTFTNGSGDTTYDYLLLLLIFIIATASTIVWSLIDWKSNGYPTLSFTLQILVRFYIGLMLVGYGLFKVFKLQFPDPDPYVLAQTYGESSPMRLAWTFLGYSYGYNIFMGIAELLAALLFFRRTVTIGAIITLGTTLNIMAVNYFFDVPVKILSTALVIMTAYLLSDQIVPLFEFFFRGRAAQLQPVSAPLFLTNRKAKLILTSVKYLIIITTLSFGITGAYELRKKILSYKREIPDYVGSYHVGYFVIDGDTIQPSPISTTRWKEVNIQSNQYATVQHMNDSTERYLFHADTLKRTMQFVYPEDTTYIYNFAFKKENNELLLQTDYRGKNLYLRLFKWGPKDQNTMLTTRGFHWINETPFNK
jgi:hypothetical protein